MEPKHEPPDPTHVKAGEPPLGTSRDAEAAENHLPYAVNGIKILALLLALLLSIVTIIGGCLALWFLYAMMMTLKNFKGH